MSFTANVKDGDGNAVASGNVVVEIYDAASSGSLIYNSSTDFYNNISAGEIDIMLGSGSQTLNLIYGKDYYMEVYVNNVDLDFSGNERQQFQASVGNVTSERIGNVSASSILSDANLTTRTINTATNNTYDIGSSANFFANLFVNTLNLITRITGSQIAENTITSANILDATIDSDDIAEGAINSTHLSGLANYESTYNATYDSLVNNASYLSTYNATYDIWAYNQTTAGAITSYANIALTNQTNTFAANQNISGQLNVSGQVILATSSTANVGINTTSPTSALNVTGNVGVTGSVTASAFYGDGSALTGLVTANSWKFTDSIYNDTATAKVGINTSTPTQLLDVKGAINVSVTEGTPYIYFGKGGYIYDNGNALVLGHRPSN